MRRADAVRELVESIDRGDAEGVLCRLHPAVVAELDFELVAQTRRIAGKDEASRRLEAMLELPMSFTVEEVRDVGDLVLAIVTLDGRSPDGQAWHARTGSLWTIEDDRVHRIVAYLDAEDAERHARRIRPRAAFAAFANRRRSS
jgi:ketosteroid isomerase-like protein